MEAGPPRERQQWEGALTFLLECVPALPSTAEQMIGTSPARGSPKPSEWQILAHLSLRRGWSMKLTEKHTGPASQGKELPQTELGNHR